MFFISHLEELGSFDAFAAQMSNSQKLFEFAAGDLCRCHVASRRILLLQ